MTIQKRNRLSNDALTGEQVKVLLAGIDNPQDKIMIKMGIYSGCRVNEIRNLRVENCDFIQHKIKVWDNKHNKWAYKKELSMATGKKVKDYKISEGKWRDIAMPKALMQELEAYIAQNPTQKEEIRKDQYGMPDGDGKGNTIYVWDTAITTWERRVQKWTMKTLRIKKSWHCLRHTYMSLHRERDTPIEYVMKQTGDTGPTVLNVYSQVSPDAIKKHTEKDLLGNV